MVKKATAKKTSRKKAAKRELIDTGADKRFVRRGARGKFKESDDVGKSLTADPHESEDEGEERARRQRRPLGVLLLHAGRGNACRAVHQR